MSCSVKLSQTCKNASAESGTTERAASRRLSASVAQSRIIQGRSWQHAPQARHTCHDGEGELTMPVAVAADAAGLGIVGLASLLRLTRGVAEVSVGLVDGPVVSGHPDLAGANLRFAGPLPGTCASPGGRACEHATFLAGVLAGRRGSAAPALCPGCTLVVRPIFREGADSGEGPQSTPAQIGRGSVR